MYFPRWYTLNYKHDSFTGLQQSNPRTSNVIIPMHLLIFLIIVCAYCSSLDHNPLNIYHCWAIVGDQFTSMLMLIKVAALNEENKWIKWNVFLLLKFTLNLTVCFTSLEENCEMDFKLKNLQVMLSCLRLHSVLMNCNLRCIYVVPTLWKIRVF